MDFAFRLEDMGVTGLTIRVRAVQALGSEECPKFFLEGEVRRYGGRAASRVRNITPLSRRGRGYPTPPFPANLRFDIVNS
jgi:hypothetical protein